MTRSNFSAIEAIRSRRTSRFAILMFVSVALVAGGCSEAPSKPPAADVAEPDIAVVDVPAVEDAEVWLLDLPDTVECPGAAGCLCQEDGDCNSGLCTEAPDGKRCGVLCGSGCPVGTVCRTANTAGEPINYCAPVGVRQCAPCQTSADCNAPWSAPAVCASGGAAGSFCASSCVADSDCPGDLKSQQVDVSGGKQLACAPASGIGSCSCSAWAIANNSTTACDVAAGTDLCPGSRSCSAAGLSECKATPGAACVDAGCKGAKDGSPCDDGDPCTNSVCTAGVCGPTDNLCQCQQTSDCKDDADLCNGQPLCDKSQVPYGCKTNPATVVTCPLPANPCKANTCAPATGLCAETDKPAGTPCDDGDPCTQSECQAGTCTVTDSDLCECQSTADCPDDANLCNGKPFCDKSASPYKCATNPATVVKCQPASDQCQLAVCQPQSGTCAVVDAPDTTACDDGKACTVGDVCLSGSCTSGTVTCACGQDADCVPYEDGNACNGTLFCNKAAGKCQINPKIVVQCPSVLDNECQQNQCDPSNGACSLAFSPTITLCEDGNPCSASDHCDGTGGCTSSVGICPCTTDGDCASKEDANLCNGTLFCELTSKTCQLNPATVVVCPVSGGNPCSPIQCQPNSGECEASPVLSGSCDDGDPCTAPGSCMTGQCVAGPDICQCKSAADCLPFDDGNPCNGTFYCDTLVGKCKPNLANVPACAPSLDPCVLNVCDPGSNGCKQVATPDGTQCQDGEACTKNDRCQAGNCTAGLVVCACLEDSDCADQDDGDPCNGWWFCDKSDGPAKCAFSAVPAGSCVDVVEGDVSDVSDGGDSDASAATDALVVDPVGDASDVAADVSATSGCGDSVCSSGEEAVCALDCGCELSADASPCDDDNACTKEDQCSSGVCLGVAVCDDGYPSSTDSCDPVTGVCKHLWPETCDGIDNDEDGTTDNVVCGSGACTCGSGGVATCPADCAVCPDDGDLAIPIDDGGVKKLVCAHDYPAWGVIDEAPDTFTDNGDGTISDSLTGLQWQKVVGSNTYTWAGAKTYCDSLSLATKEDWRLPTQFELESLVDFAKTSQPAIAAKFPLDNSNEFFWSATSFPGVTSVAWGASFDLGYSIYSAVDDDKRVRCVRHMPTTPSVSSTTGNGRYKVDAVAMTVYDRATGLTWQREPTTTGGDGAGLFLWAEAKVWCADLVLDGQNDWRLPGIVELRTLVQRNNAPTHAIDSIAFSNTPLGASPHYWSATPMLSGALYAWKVYFDNGGSSYHDITEANRVRCVRSPTCGDGQCEPGEVQGCVADCGCGGADDAIACDDGNACTTADQCTAGICDGIAADCDDGYLSSADSCDPVSGACKHLWPETCDGIDNDEDGTTDDVVCGSGACTCGSGGVATCPEDCTVCPDVGDLAIPIDDNGVKKVVCAHDYPAWGVVAEAPATFTDNGDGTISDSLTGLQWQSTVAPYNYDWSAAKVYCDDLTLATKQDWRLPTQFELETLVDFAMASAPTIAAQFIAATPNVSFRSATPYQGGSSDAWYVDHKYGGNSNYGSVTDANGFRMRCVRDEKASNASSVTANGRYVVETTDKTVYDKVTGLTWQREPPTNGGDGTGLFQGDAAKTWCADLVLAGQSDWRLPGIVELRTLVRRKSTGKSIDSVAFPNTPVGGTPRYWSTTPAQGASSKAWSVDFNDGSSTFTTVGPNYRVRCVR